MSYIQDTGHELVNCFIISIYFQSNLAIVFTFLKYQHSSWPDVARVLSTASKRGGEHVRGVKRSSSVACTFRESPPPPDTVGFRGGKNAKCEIQKSRAVVVVGKHSRARRHWFRAQDASGRWGGPFGPCSGRVRSEGRRVVG